MLLLSLYNALLFHNHFIKVKARVAWHAYHQVPDLVLIFLNWYGNLLFEIWSILWWFWLNSKCSRYSIKVIISVILCHYHCSLPRTVPNRTESSRFLNHSQWCLAHLSFCIFCSSSPPFVDSRISYKFSISQLKENGEWTHLRMF